MRGFTLWEPWASLMAHGYKKNETRSWSTKYRGPLAIHAAKTQKAIYDFKFRLVEAGIIKSFTDDVPEGFPTDDKGWPFGKIVCVVDLVDCVSTEDIQLFRGVSKMEYACGDYGDGRFAWVTTNLRRLKTPIPWKGMQGLWRMPEVLAQQIT